MSKLYLELCVLVPLYESEHEHAMKLMEDRLIEERRRHRGLKSKKKTYKLAPCNIHGCDRTVRGGRDGMCGMHTKLMDKQRAKQEAGDE